MRSSPGIGCWLVDYGAPTSKIEFLIMPEDFSDQKTINYEESPILGRSEPVFGYGGSGPRNIALTLQFLDEENTQTEVSDKVDWLQSFAYPDYDGAVIQPPHKVVLIWGRFMAIVCLIRDISVTWKSPWDFALRPFMAEVSLQFTVINSKPLGFSDIRGGKHRRSISPSVQPAMRDIEYNTMVEGMGGR